MKRFPLSAYQKAALQQVADEGELIARPNVTLSSLVRRGDLIAEDIEGSEERIYRLNTIQTVGDLMIHLATLDPAMRIGIPKGNNGLVKPVKRVTSDILYVDPKQRKFATVERHFDKPELKRRAAQRIGPILIFE